MLSAFPVLDASNNSLSILLKPDLCVGTLALRVLDLSTNHITDPLPSTLSPLRHHAKGALSLSLSRLQHPPTTTDKVIYNGSKLTSVVVYEPLQMTRC
jgi:hypothetical protein